MNELENMLEKLLEDLGESLGVSLKKISLILYEGFKEILDFRFLTDKQKKKKLIVISLLIVISVMIFFYAEFITKLYSDYLTKFDNTILNFLLYRERITKVLSNFFIFIYLLILGSNKIKEKEEMDYNMNAIGFTLKEKRTIISEEGKNIKVSMTPLLINHSIPSDDTEMFIFSFRGTTMEMWAKNRVAMEDFLNLKIIKLEKTRSNKSIRIMATTAENYEELTSDDKLVLEYNNDFEIIGLKGKGYKKRIVLGAEIKEANYPTFIKDETKVINNKNVKTLTFKSVGTELEDWKIFKYKMENVFNCLVHEIKQTEEDKQLFEVVTLDLKDNLKKLYEWNDEYIISESGVIVIGEGLLEKVTLDLKKTPHILVAGITDSGKSVLMNCIVWQLIKQGCHVIPIDFKNGIELGMFKSFSEVITKEKDVLKKVKELKVEHDARLELFEKYGVKNISEFNKKVSEKDQLTRIMVVIDEAAELMVRDGKSGAIVKILEEIEAEVASLTRVSRATGIHLMLGTQRPDAKVITGQIKNNLGGRICGRMTDKEPSIMILGSPDAMRIPDIKGRYLFSAGSDLIPMQAYFFKEEHVVEGDYRKGRLLTIDDNDRRVNLNKKAPGVNLEKEVEEVEIIDIEFDTHKSEYPQELKRQSETVEKILVENEAEINKTKRVPLAEEVDQEPIPEIIEVHNDEDDEYELYDDFYDGEATDEEAEEVEEVS